MACSFSTNARRLEFLLDLSVEEPKAKLSKARRSINYGPERSEISACE